MKLRFAFVVALLAAQHLFAANPGKAVVDEVKRYGSDAAAIVRAPLQWDEAMWRKVAIITAADAAAFAADESIADFVQRNRSHAGDQFAKTITPFGGGRALQVSGATLLLGLATHNPRLRDTGRDAIEASIFAAGFITPAIKRVAGRSRPLENEGAFAFDPFSGNESFPSGHATNAFAVASVFAAHSEGWVVPAIAYTLATGVAVSRVNDNVHFTSDVIAGAAIGTAIGRSIVVRHRRAARKGENTPAAEWAIVPARGGVAFAVWIPTARIVHAFARR
jgi:membrane-associated phospholipid phosphatase